MPASVPATPENRLSHSRLWRDAVVLTGALAVLNAAFAPSDPGWMRLNPSPWLLVPALMGARGGLLTGVISGAGISMALLLTAVLAQGGAGGHALLLFALPAAGFVCGQAHAVLRRRQDTTAPAAALPGDSGEALAATLAKLRAEEAGLLAERKAAAEELRRERNDVEVLRGQVDAARVSVSGLRTEENRLTEVLAALRTDEAAQRAFLEEQAQAAAAHLAEKTAAEESRAAAAALAESETRRAGLAALASELESARAAAAARELAETTRHREELAALENEAGARRARVEELQREESARRESLAELERGESAKRAVLEELEERLQARAEAANDVAEDAVISTTDEQERLSQPNAEAAEAEANLLRAERDALRLELETARAALDEAETAADAGPSATARDPEPAFSQEQSDAAARAESLQADLAALTAELEAARAAAQEHEMDALLANDAVEALHATASEQFTVIQDLRREELVLREALAASAATTIPAAASESPADPAEPGDDPLPALYAEETRLRETLAALQNEESEKRAFLEELETTIMARLDVATDPSPRPGPAPSTTAAAVESPPPDVTALRGERDEMARELETARAALEAVEADNRRLLEEQARGVSATAEAAAAAEPESSQAAALRNERAELVQELESARAALEAIESENRILRGEQAAALSTGPVTESATAAEEEQETGAETEGRRVELAVLTAELETAREAAAQSQAGIAEAHENLAALQAAAAEQRALLEELRREEILLREALAAAEATSTPSLQSTPSLPTPESPHEESAATAADLEALREAAESARAAQAAAESALESLRAELAAEPPRRATPPRRREPRAPRPRPALPRGPAARHTSPDTDHDGGAPDVENPAEEPELALEEQLDLMEDDENLSIDRHLRALFVPGPTSVFQNLLRFLRDICGVTDAAVYLIQGDTLIRSELLGGGSKLPTGLSLSATEIAGLAVARQTLVTCRQVLSTVPAQNSPHLAALPWPQPGGEGGPQVLLLIHRMRYFSVNWRTFSLIQMVCRWAAQFLTLRNLAGTTPVPPPAGPLIVEPATLQRLLTDAVAAHREHQVSSSVLTLGLPEDAAEDASEALRALATACMRGTDLAAPEGRGLRVLLTFEDADAATAFAGDVRHRLATAAGPALSGADVSFLLTSTASGDLTPVPFPGTKAQTFPADS